MSSPLSGLSDPHRIQARDLAVKAAILGRDRNASLQYTEGAQRWDGIHRNLKAYKGECPKYADCSAFTTWCLWNGLDHFGVRDCVNGENWLAGFTGTQREHGQLITNGYFLRADLVHYDSPQHVAIYVGGGMVISFGGEPGPRYLPMDYRKVVQVRRYI